MSVLVFPDAASLTDLRTYAARLRRLDPDGALRLHASGGLLAAYAGVLPGRGVTGSGAVIGLRILTLAKPAQVDATVIYYGNVRVGAAELAPLKMPVLGLFAGNDR